jgi:hypothetical protein
VEEGGFKGRFDGIRHGDPAWKQSDTEERGEQPHDRGTRQIPTVKGAGTTHDHTSSKNALVA